MIVETSTVKSALVRAHTRFFARRKLTQVRPHPNSDIRPISGSAPQTFLPLQASCKSPSRLSAVYDPDQPLKAESERSSGIDGNRGDR
jgi:hypothetical protein